MHTKAHAANACKSQMQCFCLVCSANEDRKHLKTSRLLDVSIVLCSKHAGITYQCSCSNPKPAV